MRYRIDEQTGRLGSHEQRIELIEAKLGDKSRHITIAQASRISQSVKAIGLELSSRSGRNEFGGVYGELHRRFQITSYHELPANKYDEAMGFLREWYQALNDTDAIPF